jgi:hypothetical protein
VETKIESEISDTAKTTKPVSDLRLNGSTPSNSKKQLQRNVKVIGRVGYIANDPARASHYPAGVPA